ncbi:MAG: hypothetical protein M1840_006099 [Geoglossum simile]|nr:MAG: hypothetical protein M1840_006099 [Geoglossum simile]
MGHELKQHVEYLINDLKAYQDYDHGKKGLCHVVKHDLYMWKKHKTKGQQLEMILEEDWRTFLTYSSNGNHLRIEDKYRYLLIYSIPIPSEYTETLSAIADLIPSSRATKHRRGHTSEKYWGL